MPCDVAKKKSLPLHSSQCIFWVCVWGWGWGGSMGSLCPFWYLNPFMPSGIFYHNSLDRCISKWRPSGHTTKQRRFNVDSTSWYWINVELTLFQRCVPAGGCLIKFLLISSLIEIPGLNANNVDPDQKPRSAAYDLGLLIARGPFLNSQNPVPMQPWKLQSYEAAK